ncbi:phosphatidylinositol transfer protein, putative [Pediculus humanus corporis]|uniref:Phosphatidylinositol transfer protein, putative n=1 Tax=Pediculus humanus subsp. corporis TaxID=121224 RepID=E0VY81_PEDHC|nr:phosphatidylinositol transfer protein, putative [Pediculus humanus corporis]EEB18337.1 phosphatidylinositol transfer protein, putative [Pediculus humanus corporis]
MLIKEYRVTLPLSVEEYHVAQLFCVAEASKENTGGGEGIEVLKNEPFDNHPLLSGQYSKGQYTYKIYHIASKVPAFVRLLCPKGSLEIHEEAWNAYPYCRTVITNPGYMKENFLIMIESFHINDSGYQENVHQLPPEKLKQREVIHIDIANDKMDPRDYKREDDPTLFTSQKTGRGPLVGKWQKEFTTFHRQVFCSIDRWYGLTIADIRALEEKTKQELDKQRNQGEVRGMRTGD